MKLTRLSVALVSLALLFSFCKQHKYTAENLPEQQIRFGKGGGFTGVETMYTLLENGQLFDTSKKELPKIKARTAKGYFKTLETLGLSALPFSHPGNTYSFVEIPGASGVNRIVWGDANYPVDAAVKDFYTKLMSATTVDSNEK